MQHHQIRSFRSTQELMRDNMLVKHYAGSIAYGTALPTSDVDFRGVFCADPVNVRTPFFIVRECDDKSEEDTKLFELTHFMKLCLDCNPNVVETLWVDDSDITFSTPAYDLLRENRDKLLSSKIAFTTSIYALAQLKRIKGHNKWINNPQGEQPPRQCDYLSLVQNFTLAKIMSRNIIDMERKNHRLIPYGGDIYGVYEAEGYELYSDDFTLNTVYDKDDTSYDRKKPKYIVKFNKSAYNTDKERWKQYWDWKKPKDNKAKLFYKLEAEIQRRALKK